MWPDDRDLPVEVQAAFGANLTADPGTWSWTDLASRLRNAPITTRVPGPGSPGTCSVTLDNDDGALSPLNPMSAYWPNVELGTPLRVRLRRAEDAFARTASSGWGTADSGQAWTTGGTAAADFSVSAGVGRHAHPTVNNIRRTFLATSLVDSEQVVDVATSALLTGAALVTGFLFRYQDPSNYYWLRCEFNSGGTSVMLKLTKCVAGGFTDLASLNPVPGVPYAANTYLRVRASVVGSRLSMKVWNPAGAEPAGWQVTATDTALTAAGANGLQSWLVLGNTNALPVTALHKSYAVRVDRFTGNADQWEPTYLPIRPGESSSAVRVTASGILRRLNQGTKPARSSPARFIPTINPVAYWPLEDGQLVSEGAALVGGEPMRPFVGTHPSGAVVTFVQWGRGELAPWLPDAVSRTGSHGLSIIWAPVRMSATSQWCVDFIYRSGTDAGNSTVDVNPSYLPGGSLPWGGQLTLLPEFQGVDVAMNGEPEVTGTASTLFDGQPHHVRWYVWQDGLKVSWGVYVDGAAVNGGTTIGNFTLPPVTSIALAAAAQSGADMAQGHLAVWASNPNHPACIAAALGHPGEAAADRVARLCAEDGIAVSVLPGDSEPMGPQPTAGLMDLLREAEEADLGVLFELGYGLGYRPRGARYNTPTSMTVDLASYAVSDRGGDVLSPTYDDQDLRNEWTVSRRGGRSETAADTVHQQRSGVYDDSAELNVASDGVLADHAWWRVHLGTFPRLREDTFPLDLAANPGLLDGWLSCGLGSRIVRTNPPSQYGPEPLDRLVEGWSETIGPRSWLTQVTPSPAQPWDVATVDGEPRIAADGSTLAAGITAAAISTINTNPFFEVDASGWFTDPGEGSIIRSTAQAHQGAASLLLTPDGVGSQAAARSAAVAGVSPGQVLHGSAWMRCAVARSVTLRIDWRNSVGTILSVSTVTVALSANTWTYFDLVATAPASTTQAGMTAVMTGTPPASHLLNVDEALLQTTISVQVGFTPQNGPWTTDAADFPLDVRVGGERVTVSAISGTSSPQTFTASARGVNGVQRAWAAGTEVDVWFPAIVAL